jgi:hypothetical protein
MSAGERRQAGARIHVTNEMVMKALPILHHWKDSDQRDREKLLRVLLAAW